MAAGAGASASVVEKQITARTTGKRNAVGGTTEGAGWKKDVVDAVHRTETCAVGGWWLLTQECAGGEGGSRAAEERSSQLAECQSRD